jgi:hypothetical protein
LISNGTCFSEPRASNVLWQRSTPIIVGCWFAGCTWKNKKLFASPAALCPLVADPCSKQNCMLNQALGTSQQSWGFLLLCYKECAVALRVTVENFHLFQSFHHNQHNCGGTCSQHCAMKCFHIMCIKTAHKLGYLYIYRKVILCGSLLVLMVCVCVLAKLNVEVCLVAQWAVRCKCQCMKEDNFPVL